MEMPGLEMILPSSKASSWTRKAVMIYLPRRGSVLANISVFHAVNFQSIAQRKQDQPAIMASAFIGQPPYDQADYWIVKGILRRLNVKDRDPAKGVLIPPSRPLDDRYESRGPRIIAANIVCIVLIISITGTRLLIRALRRGLRWGWDDWMIFVASVSLHC